MLYAILDSKKRILKKTLIGIGSTGYEGNPCNMHLNDFMQEVKKEFNEG
jgi:dihydroxy-acid dehydratase